MAKTTFVDGDKSLGIRGTVVSAAFLNALNTHRHDGADEDGHGALNFAVAGGTANAITLTLTPTLTAHVQGMPIIFKAGVSSNTSSVTININGLGAVSIRKRGTTALASGDIAANQMVMIAYDGTYYQLIGLIYLTGEGLEVSSGSIRVKLDGATLTRAATGLKVTDNTFAALAGLATQAFEAADGASNKEVVNISQFGKSLATNGYQKLPGGLIFQWGQATSSGSTVDVTLPITFPTAMRGQGATDAGSGRVPCGCSSLSTSQIRIYTGSSGVTAQWWAIGH